ncbi:MAG: hypothetical protein GY914_12210 [Prochlorococcus sp.]|nr:hypothetical protein [Candidatus Brocadiaceae bacterium]MCP4974408.1 hypothetical protein [Prochlorococcus sp.]
MKTYSQSKISKINYDELELPCKIVSRDHGEIALITDEEINVIDCMPVTDLRINTIKKREALQSKLSKGAYQLAIYSSTGLACGANVSNKLEMYIKKP